MFLVYSSRWKEKLRLVQSSCCGRNGTGCKSRGMAVDAQQTLLSAFLSGPTIKKKILSREFLLMEKKKCFLKGEGFHFIHVVSGTSLASSFLRSLTSQAAWNGEISSPLLSNHLVAHGREAL